MVLAWCYVGYQDDQNPLWLCYATQPEVGIALRQNSSVIQLSCHEKADCFWAEKKTFSKCQGLYWFAPIKIPHPGCSCNWIHYLSMFIILHSHSPKSFKLLHLPKGQIKWDCGRNNYSASFKLYWLWYNSLRNACCWGRECFVSSVAKLRRSGQLQGGRNRVVPDHHYSPDPCVEFMFPVP